MSNMKIEHRVIGQVATNVFLVLNKETKEAFIVDPADRADYIKKWIQEAGVTLKAILLTHGHFDHILAVNELKSAYQTPVYAMAAEKVVLSDPNLNLSGNWMRNAVSVKVEEELKDEQEFSVAGFRIIAYHTPGHTKGGACYYLPEEKTLFSGDTLFYHEIGRTDLPTGSYGELVRSVRRLTEILEGETAVYPGHEEYTNIADEKMYNPYI